MGAITIEERALGKNSQDAFQKIKKRHIKLFGDDYYGGSFSNARLATSRGFDLTHIKSSDKQERELRKLRKQWWGSHGKNEVGFAVLKVSHYEKVDVKKQKKNDVSAIKHETRYAVEGPKNIDYFKSLSEAKRFADDNVRSHGEEHCVRKVKVSVGAKDDVVWNYEPEIKKSQRKGENNTSIYEFEFFALVPE